MGKKFIYNPQQAMFYINNGVECIDQGNHTRTGKAFWVFIHDETNEAYAEWCNREERYRDKPITDKNKLKRKGARKPMNA